MTNWISCEKGFPDYDEEVFVWVESDLGSFMTISYRTIAPNHFVVWAPFECPQERITHWMPLPEPPVVMVDVQIGRLQRKIEKLQKQRDHYKSELAHYQHVIAMQPYLLKSYKDYEDAKVEREKSRANAKRVIEQEQLIKRLLKESTI